MTKVVVRDLTDSLVDDVAAVFAPFGGIRRMAGDRAVLVKPNGVHFLPGQATENRLLEALFRHLKDQGAVEIFLMENCTAGNLTRAVFAALGWDKLCRRYGVKPVYLDEGPVRRVELSGENAPMRFPEWLCKRLIDEPEANFYLSVPRLKTHSMSHVTLGIKNQMGLLIHEDRMKDHNHLLGDKLTRILTRFRPDFTLVEGLTATIYGHFPITRDLEKSIVDARVLIGGDDVAAVDTVGARVLGYQASEIDHIRIAGDKGLGCTDLGAIEVIGSLDRFTERYPYMPEIEIPHDIRMVYGKDMACYQGCRGNTEIALYMFASDYGGKGGFNVIMGKGVELEEIAGLSGDFLVVGPCAAKEVGHRLAREYPDRRILIVPEHNDLAQMSGKLARLMRPRLIRNLPVNPLRAIWIILTAMKNRTTARMINPF